jgi:hypothetical protein
MISDIDAQYQPIIFMEEKLEEFSCSAQYAESFRFARAKLLQETHGMEKKKVTLYKLQFLLGHFLLIVGSSLVGSFN